MGRKFHNTKKESDKIVAFLFHSLFGLAYLGEMLAKSLRKTGLLASS